MINSSFVYLEDQYTLANIQVRRDGASGHDFVEENQKIVFEFVTGVFDHLIGDGVKTT